MNDAPFPAIAAAALLAGGGVFVLSQYDRKAAYTVAIILLLGIAYNREVIPRATELVNALTGRYDISGIVPGNPAGGNVPRNTRVP